MGMASEGGTTSDLTCAACVAGTPFSASDNRLACQTDLLLCATTQYESAAPTAAADRQCTTHDVCTDDSPAEYEFKAPTPTDDRVCSGAGTCPNGVLISTAVARTGPNQCQSCSAGFYLTSSKACASCPAGFKCTGSSKVACGANEYATGGASVCIAQPTCGAGSLPWTMASNARSTTCDTSADVSAPGGKGARTLCAACQNASCKVRDRPSGFLSPLLDASALACC